MPAGSCGPSSGPAEASGCGPGPAGAEQEGIAPASSDDGAARQELVAVGDVHGDVDALRSSLRAALLVDGADRWIGGDRTLVFTGDLLDRGPSEQAVLALVQALQEQAAAAGGAVVVLLGNHEIMNVAGDLRYVAEEGWGDWGPVRDDPRLADVPPHARSRVSAFLPGGSVSSWLATLAVVQTLDGTVFVHGGLLQHHVDHGIARINEETAAWIRGEAPFPAMLDGEESPIWTRVWSNPGQEPDCAALGRVLDAVPAQRMVVGHTVQPSGIRSACDGRLWCIDAGMSAHYGGPGGALRIRGDVVEVIDVP